LLGWRFLGRQEKMIYCEGAIVELWSLLKDFAGRVFVIPVVDNVLLPKAVHAGSMRR
jgi:hypothetical protein